MILTVRRRDDQGIGDTHAPRFADGHGTADVKGEVEMELFFNSPVVTSMMTLYSTCSNQIQSSLVPNPSQIHRGILVLHD